jgi:hypothetical protein
MEMMDIMKNGQDNKRNKMTNKIEDLKRELFKQTDLTLQPREVIVQVFDHLAQNDRWKAFLPRELILTIEGMAKQKLQKEMDTIDKNTADFEGGYDEMVKHARKLKAMIAAQGE